MYIIDCKWIICNQRWRKTSTDTKVRINIFRDCNQDQIANVSYKEDIVEIQTGTTEKTITVGETQPETGTNASSGWEIHTSLFTDWINDGASYNYSEYLPVIDNRLCD